VRTTQNKLREGKEREGKERKGKGREVKEGSEGKKEGRKETVNLFYLTHDGGFWFLFVLFPFRYCNSKEARKGT